MAPLPSSFDAATTPEIANASKNLLTEIIVLLHPSVVLTNYEQTEQR